MADALGADFLGVVLAPGFGRSVAVASAEALVRGVRAMPVAVLVDQELGEAASAAEALGAGVVQLHGDESPGFASSLRDSGPWRVWKAVRVKRASEVPDALTRYEGAVDGLLVEGWRRGVVGGGGGRADLAALETVCADWPSGLDLVLAGGLTPTNVAEGVARVHPSVVDVSSGVEEAHGRKSRDLVRRFIEAARSGLRPPNGVQR